LLVAIVGLAASPYGGAEIAIIGKRKYGKYNYKTVHYERMKHASAENASTSSQGWKTQRRKYESAGLKYASMENISTQIYRLFPQQKFLLVHERTVGHCTF